MNWLKSINLRQRFLLLVVFLAVTVAIEGGFIFSLSTTVTNNAAEIARQRAPLLNKAHQAKLAVVQVQQWLQDISATRGLDGLNDGFDEAEKNARRFRELIEDMKSLDPANSARYESMLPVFARYYETGRRMAQAYIDEGPAGGNRMMPEFDEVAENMANEVDSFLADSIEQTTAALIGQEESAGSTQVAVAIGSMIILAGIVIIYLTIARALSHLPKAVAELQRVADGDLTSTTEVSRHDEIGDLMRGVQSMRGRLHEIVNKISNLTTELSSAAEQISAATTQTSANLQNGQHETTLVATAIEEMSATAAEVSRNSTTTADAVREASTRSTEGLKMVTESNAAIDTLVRNVDTTSGMIQKVEKDCEGISSVLDVIRGVAEQTNLLALNAAIEAARAGEQGRGFAVVADEVRNLASRTKESTEEIHQIIDQLQSGSRQAVESMNQSHEQTQSVAAYSTEMGQSLEAIAEAIQKIHDMSSQIASAAEEQSATTISVSQSITHVNDITSQNATAAEQITASSQSLASMSAELDGLVRHFRL